MLFRHGAYYHVLGQRERSLCLTFLRIIHFSFFCIVFHICSIANCTQLEFFIQEVLLLLREIIHLAVLWSFAPLLGSLGEVSLIDSRSHKSGACLDVLPPRSFHEATGNCLPIFMPLFCPLGDSPHLIVKWSLDTTLQLLLSSECVLLFGKNCMEMERHYGFI